MNLKKKLKDWCRTSSKRITIVFLLAFTQFQMVYANTVVGGWSFTNPVSQGASTAWDATKNMGDKVAKGVASIKPTPSQVAKGILKGGLVGAALTATEQLLEDGVDFVLDPANNTIRFTKKDTAICLQDGSNCPNSEFLYTTNTTFYKDFKSIYVGFNSTPTEACYRYINLDTELFGHSYTYLLNTEKECKYTYGDQTRTITISKIQNSTYQPKQETLPIETVASKIIDNADANDKEAEKYVNTVAQDLLDHDEATQQIAISQADNSAKIQPPKGVPSTSENSANATPPPDDEDEQSAQKNSEEELNTLLERGILKNARFMKTSGKDYRIYDKDGGIVQLNKDFESLGLSNVKDIQTSYGLGRVGQFNNRINVATRNGSKRDGRPTVEIQFKNFDPIKIRYNP